MIFPVNMSATSPAVTTRRTANQAPVRCKSKVRADGENGRPWTRRKTPRWVLRIAGKLLWLPHRAATAPWLTLRSGARVSGGRRWGTVAVARMSIESTVRPRRGSGEISARRRSRGSTPLAIPGRWCRGRGRRACLRPRTHPPSQRAPFCRRPCACRRTSPSEPSRLRARRTARSRKTLKSHRQYPTQRPQKLGGHVNRDLARGVL